MEDIDSHLIRLNNIPVDFIPDTIIKLKNLIQDLEIRWKIQGSLVYRHTRLCEECDNNINSCKCEYNYATVKVFICSICKEPRSYCNCKCFKCNNKRWMCECKSNNP